MGVGVEVEVGVAVGVAVGVGVDVGVGGAAWHEQGLSVEPVQTSPGGQLSWQFGTVPLHLG